MNQASVLLTRQQAKLDRQAKRILGHFLACAAALDQGSSSVSRMAANHRLILISRNRYDVLADMDVKPAIFLSGAAIMLPYEKDKQVMRISAVRLWIGGNSRV